MRTLPNVTVLAALTASALAGDPPPEQAEFTPVGGDLAMIGRILYQTTDDGVTLIVRDLEAPCDPTLLPPLSGDFDAETIDIRGDLGAVRNVHGVRIIDVSAPESPVLRSTVNLPGDERTAIIRGGFLYVSTTILTPLPVVTISRLSLANPASPGAPVTVLTGPGTPERFDIHANTLVSASFLGLSVYDLSAPGGASLVTQFPTTSPAASAVVARDGLAYVLGVGGAPTSLDIVRLNPPAPPQLLDTITIDGRAADLAFEGDTLFIAVERYSNSSLPEIQPGVLAVDIRDPANAETLWFFELDYSPRAIARGDGVLVVTGTLLSDRSLVFADEICFPDDGCNGADLSEPYGVLNFDDVLAFLQAFAAMIPPADLAPPEDVWNFDDVIAFLALFAQGCPI